MTLQTDPDNSEETPNTSVISLDTTNEGVNLDVTIEPYFEPVVTLPEVIIKTNEEDEVELFKM